MKPLKTVMRCALALAFAAAAASGPAFAEKPGWAGNGKGGKNDRSDRGERNDRGDQKHDGGPRGERREHFGDRHRTAARDYYDDQYRHGRCPPGLAKKHNGCMPPGQAKKWQHGHSLPRNVTYYSVPRPLLLQLGEPPQGYRYVRVSSDILLMETATRMIVDSILNLGQG